jgi:hypothetical protein
MAKKTLTPGTRAPRSGQYRNTKTRAEVTVTRGERLPPTPHSGQAYRMITDSAKQVGRKIEVKPPERNPVSPPPKKSK